ncbi:hypothetical protein PF005_g28624 [Phytophthora fragariae]|uniref:Uncharacterized protein n=2 Tax=Phytophthora TaxID=4783 RepID=A0A6A4BG35_9STRA|nr:hypothetical protein PF003_g36208 [Phytophthora fragariae]KAE8973380.1 hypothetical protein PR002_g26218 [Phytophthora rubi]KAE8920610.1 hypothetical protein PF009_g29099 [Phytophthora fragariae]KAE8967279.1 hypothetical protein PF011_g27610 [Phytophthora fragariae]KAE8974210.1 hypothetical protein PR001_g26061 [Phytophthora rubi]
MPTPYMQSLQHLSKVELLPTRSSELSATLSFLEKIDHIEINGTTERNGVVYYQVDVFLQHHTSHILTIKIPQSPITQTTNSNGASATSPTSASRSGCTHNANTTTITAASTATPS